MIAGWRVLFGNGHEAGAVGDIVPGYDHIIGSSCAAMIGWHGYAKM